MTRNEVYNLLDAWRDAEVAATITRRMADELRTRLLVELDTKYPIGKV